MTIQSHSDDVEQRAYSDLDAIASMSNKALAALSVGNVERAEDILQDIQTTADAWEDPSE